MITGLNTLSDHLLLNGISREEACIIFGRSPKTLKRWNESPPEWVLKIIQLLGVKPPFPDCWEDWHFDRHWLVDPAGNSFHINDVKNIWIERQLAKTLHGDETDIYSLKLELEKKIKELESDVTITVELGGLKKHFDITLKEEKVYSFK